LQPSSSIGPTTRIQNFSERALKSISPLFAIIRKASSQPPGDGISSMRSGKSERLRQAEGMGDACAGCGVKCFIAVRDTCRAFHNQEMLIFILVNRYGRAVTAACDDLDDRTNGSSLLAELHSQHDLTPSRKSLRQALLLSGRLPMPTRVRTR
jgi:hypothetical protein